MVFNTSNDRSYQWSFTQEFTPLDQTANSHVKVGASTAPVSNAVEWVICQNILYKREELLTIRNKKRMQNGILFMNISGFVF